MIPNQFSYLVDDASSSFFQKVAEEISGARPAPAPRKEMTKTAAYASAFEKISSTLDNDIVMLAAGGDCGFELGMCKRASLYLERVENTELELEPEQYAEIFEKVSAAAIDRDIGVALEKIANAGLPAEEETGLKRAVFQVGQQLAEAAEIEKQAFLGGLSRALMGVRVGGRVAAGLGGRALRASGRGIVGAAKATGRTVARPFKAAIRKAREGSLATSKENLAIAQRGLGAAAKNPSIIGTELTKALVPERARYAKQVNAARDAARAAKAPKAPKPVDAPKPVAGSVAPDTTAKATAEAAKAGEGATKAGEGAAAAAKAPAGTKPKYEPPPPVAGEKSEGYRKAETGLTKNQEAAKKGGDVIDINSGKKRGGGSGGKKGGGAQPKEAPAPGASAEPGAPAVAGSIGDTLKKMQNSGWGSLNSAEKTKLITSGVGVVAGHRVLTGRDVISGDKSE